MKPSSFETLEFGTVEYDEAERFYWFNPKPLPDDMRLDDETLIALSRADAAVGRLDGVAQLLPEPDLIARPYAAREAVASSRIEGTHATLQEVYETEAGRGKAAMSDVLTIRRYERALNLGLRSVQDKRLDLELLLEVHGELMRGDTSVEERGRWRTKSVWVGAPTGGPETAVFVPPPSEKLPELLQDWAQWHERSPRIPLLIRVALLHYQFLTIHPFIDGNGRVGRMLIQLFLEEEHALSAPLLYASAYFARNRREYYDRLQGVRQYGEIQQWLQYFLTAVYEQANDGVKRARDLLNLREAYRSELSGSRTRAHEVVDILFRNPVVSSSMVQAELGVSNQGASNLLRILEERGILMNVGPGGRGSKRYWLAPRILGFFDDEAVTDEDSEDELE